MPPSPVDKRGTFTPDGEFTYNWPVCGMGKFKETLDMILGNAPLPAVNL